MSWMRKLYQTYEAAPLLELEDSDQLMPICHTLQNAHIKITITEDGVFKRAETLEKTQVILPATEQSAGRSSGEAPHPLADKIQYLAKDYPEYGGKKDSYFYGYLKMLSGWCDSPFVHPKALAVKKYIEKGQVVEDLIENKVLHVDANKNLLQSWPKDTDDPAPGIFKVLPKEKGKLDQGNALVCWSVEIGSAPSSSTWKDKSLYDSWIQYDAGNHSQEGLCYVTGQRTVLAVSHPAKIRHSGDKAKLISSNDLAGFTFRGRFSDSKSSVEKHGTQSVGIGFDVTQKAHNALRWLVARQGYRTDSQVIVTWAVSGEAVPQPMEETWDFMKEDLVEQDAFIKEDKLVDHSINLGQTFASSLKKHLSGYESKFESTDNITIMGIDSATPGRMAVTYYQELFPKDYLDRISKWYFDFAWFQRYSIKGEKLSEKKTLWIDSIGSPSPRSICEAIYGDRISDSLKKSTIERILPCIVEGKPFPYDLVAKAVRRASNRSSYKSNEFWLWEKDLGIACALFKGFSQRNPKQPKEYLMALEENNISRDYLFGRLLAIADRIEDLALFVAGEKRSTTAARLMQRFADHPSSTWRNIELALQPYIQRLRSKRAGFLHDIQLKLDQIMDKFAEGEFNNDKPLSGEFLLAYHTQRFELKKKSQDKSTKSNDNH